MVMVEMTQTASPTVYQHSGMSKEVLLEKPLWAGVRA